MPECCVRSLHLFFCQRFLSHQEAGPGSPEDHEIPAALPTQVLILSPAGFCPTISTTPSSRICWFSSDSFLISLQDERTEAEPGAGRASPTWTGHLTSPCLSHHREAASCSLKGEGSLGKGSPLSAAFPVTLVGALPRSPSSTPLKC